MSQGYRHRFTLDCVTTIICVPLLLLTEFSSVWRVLSRHISDVFHKHLKETLFGVRFNSKNRRFVLNTVYLFAPYLKEDNYLADSLIKPSLTKCLQTFRCAARSLRCLEPLSNMSTSCTTIDAVIRIRMACVRGVSGGILCLRSEYGNKRVWHVPVMKLSFMCRRNRSPICSNFWEIVKEEYRNRSPGAGYIRPQQMFLIWRHRNILRTGKIMGTTQCLTLSNLFQLCVTRTLSVSIQNFY